MILLDNRIGSGDLVTFLQRWQIPHELTRIEYGDAMFVGNGPDGSSPTIGIEIKKTRDALACMCDGRFAGHQLPGLHRDYNHIWLVVEGSYGVDFNTGALTVAGKGGKRQLLTLGSRKFMYREFDAWLTTMEVKGGVHVRRTLSRVETAKFIVDMWSWWTKKEYDKHRSHLSIHQVDQPVFLTKPSLVLMIAAQLPGVGFGKASAVAKHFASADDMITASESEWAQVPGIGKTMAARIRSAIRGTE